MGGWLGCPRKPGSGTYPASPQCQIPGSVNSEGCAGYAPGWGEGQGSCRQLWPSHTALTHPQLYGVTGQVRSQELLKERESHALQCYQSQEIPVLYQGHCPFQTSRLMNRQPAALPCSQAGTPSCPIPAIPIPSGSGAGLEPKLSETEVPTHPSLSIPAEGHVMDPLIL